MNTRRFFPNRAVRLAGVLLALVVAVGATDAAAKERKRDRAAVRASAGYIGVYMQDLTRDVREGLDLKVETGVLVSGVEDEGPAAKAGLEDGDVIVSFNGKDVSTPDGLRDAVRDVAPGTDARMVIVRDGKKKTVDVTVGERPASEWSYAFGDGPGGDEFRRAFAMFGGPRLGIQAHEMSDELGSYFGAKAGEGVLVLEVETESVAAGAGVKAGDVIQKIGDEEIGDVADLRESLRDFEKGDEFTITVRRNGRSQSLTATMDEQPGHEFSRVWVDGRRHAMDRMHHMKAPRVRIPHVDRDDLRRELEDLREELEELKEKLGDDTD